MAERLDHRMCRFALQLFFLIEIHTAWILQVTSVWLYPENREYRIYFASAAISECYTTHMGDTPGPHRSLTVPTPSGRRVSKVGSRQGSAFVTTATPILCAPHQRSLCTLRSCHQVGTPANQGFYAYCLPWEPQLHKRDQPWKPGTIMGESPDTRRTLAVDNFDTPGCDGGRLDGLPAFQAESSV